MPPIQDRRLFLNRTTQIAGVMGLSGIASAEQSDRKLVIGVMGLSRGQSLAESFAAQPNVDVRYVCDVDSQRVASCISRLKDRLDISPTGLNDFRRILDAPEVDALVVAAPNHWHGPASMLACQAGKHVYVEKPCCHNPHEGELMAKAAIKHNRCVQVGTQRRSSPGWIAAIEKLKQGAIGNVYLSRAWYSNLRGSIGKQTPKDPPRHLDFDLWQGPAARVPYRDNIVHLQLALAMELG